MLASVVEDGLQSGLSLGFHYDFIQALAIDGGTGHQLVQGIDIGLMMLSVMKVQGLGRHVGL